MASTKTSQSVQEVQTHYVNKPAPNVSYFTPAQEPPAGSALAEQSSGKPVPKLFQPLKLRGLTLQNRIMLSPLCQYSAQDGHFTMWHWTHLGGIIQRGPGISFVEAHAVTAEGRITPEDAGIWKDSQIAPLKQIVDFAHSQNQKMAIQLGHAGRKASTVAPWLSAGSVAGPEVGGWADQVIAPSAIPFDENHVTPRAMTLEDIETFKAAFGEAVRRSLRAGFDVIEIHSAHGYLLHEFLSPVSNKRTDKYGGSFENRIRLLLETVDLTRQIIPDDMPLFVRISATDWLEEESSVPESWKGSDTVEVAKILATRGVDLLDVSSGGISQLQKVKSGPAYQAPFAKAVKKAVGDSMAVGTVGSIKTGEVAQQQLDDGLDLAIAGRMFQKNPGLVFAWADELGVDVQMPNQIRWGFGGRGKAKTAAEVKTNGKL